MRIGMFILAGLAVGAAAVFWMLSSEKGYVLRFSEADLKARLEQSLPYEKRYLYVFNVTLDHPRFDLVEGSDRIAGGVDVILHVKFGGEKPLSGSVDLSGGLRYDAAQRAFFLADPVVETISVEGVSARHANKANEAISLTLAEFFRTRPIYVIEPDDAPKAAAYMLLRDVTVSDGHVVVTLGLKRGAAREAYRAETLEAAAETAAP